MTVFAKYFGIKNTVTSKKNGVDYDIHLFQGSFGKGIEILTEHGEGDFQKGQDYPIDSYKGSDGKWHYKLVSLQ